MLLNAAKCQGYSFYRFWVIKGKPTGGNYPPTQRVGVNGNSQSNGDNLMSNIHKIIEKYKRVGVRNIFASGLVGKPTHTRKSSYLHLKLLP